LLEKKVSPKAFAVFFEGVKLSIIRKGADSWVGVKCPVDPLEAADVVAQVGLKHMPTVGFIWPGVVHMVDGEWEAVSRIGELEGLLDSEP
jgi:hypothetical protein